jgi:hypothetical protein
MVDAGIPEGVERGWCGWGALPLINPLLFVTLVCWALSAFYSFLTADLIVF